MQSTLKKTLISAKEASRILAVLPVGKRRAVLQTLAVFLSRKKNDIFEANKKDTRLAKHSGQNSAFIDRLTFTEATFKEMVKQVRDIARADDPLGRILEKRKLANGVMLTKKSVPLGVLAVIYESRPNVTIDVAALSLMSGNVSILKGGSDVLNTNSVLVRCVHEALKKHTLPVSAVSFLATRDRSVVDQLVKENKLVDVLIPRGGYELVKKVVEESKIPILYHASGGARIYIDTSADLTKAIQICVNAKVNRPATCNSLDAVLVHENVAKKFVPRLVKALQDARVEVRGDRETQKLASVTKATEADYATEFLDYVAAVKIVKNVDEAIAFIASHTNGHSEGIVSENNKVIETFVNAIDAAGVFVNCSTRLHDGGTFGLGAEMGIATGKLHARGPVGLSELTTYKWVAYGNGQIRR